MRQIDLSELSGEAQEAAGRAAPVWMPTACFDLAEGPLLQVSLYRLRGEEHLLLLNIHHIIADGWSMGVLLREVKASTKHLWQGSHRR